MARHVNRLGLDAVFSPMQTMGSRGRRYALVLTLHDLIYYRNRTPPREFSWPLRLGWRAFHLAWWPQRMLLNGADGSSPSRETTARADRRAPADDGGRSPSRTTPPTRRARARPAGPRERSLVYMGSFMPYKNVETLAAALPLLGADWTLHCMSRVSDADRARLEALAPGRGRVPRRCVGRGVPRRAPISDRARDGVLRRGLRHPAGRVDGRRHAGGGQRHPDLPRDRRRRRRVLRPGRRRPRSPRRCAGWRPGGRRLGGVGRPAARFRWADSAEQVCRRSSGRSRTGALTASRRPRARTRPAGWRAGQLFAALTWISVGGEHPVDRVGHLRPDGFDVDAGRAGDDRDALVGGPSARPVSLATHTHRTCWTPAVPATACGDGQPLLGAFRDRDTPTSAVPRSRTAQMVTPLPAVAAADALSWSTSAVCAAGSMVACQRSPGP